MLIATYGICDTIVYEEHFSAPFVQHDWVYNNSGSQSGMGYPGNLGQTQPWPARISDDASQLLGYSPAVYYATSFESFAIGSLSGQDGWVGTGTIGSASHGLARGANFTNQSAYRNVTSGTQGTVQYVQCYARASYNNSACYIYVGTQDLAAIGAVVRFGFTGQIEALNGDGSGDGTWVPLCDYAVDQWYRITFKLDYTNQTYRAAIQGSYNPTDLGLRDSAAAVGLRTVGFSEESGSVFFVDDVYAGNSPYAPGQDLRGYWSDSYNRWSLDYGNPINIAERDAYDWMSCTDFLGNPVNPSSAPPYKAALPTGWTAAFSAWGDIEPQDYWASGRARMGFSQLTGAYAQSADNPCLHVWSSHGDLRVASPNITTGPGVYTLTWRGGIWNLNTADPNMQYRWTDWCSWGFGYTNWCVWDEWDPMSGHLQTLPPFPGTLSWMGITDVPGIPGSSYWFWPQTPFKPVHPTITYGPADPVGYLADRAISEHPAGEQPGQWHTFSSQFAFGLCPETLQPYQGYPGYPGAGYYVGFRVGHSHSASNPGASAGYQWGTILNVDDIVLAKNDPVSIDVARKSPVGTLVEISDLVIVNMVLITDPDYGTMKYVDVYLEDQNRTSGILLRAFGDGIATIWDDDMQMYKFAIGDVVRVVGAISKDDPNYTRLPQPDSRNPVAYISGWLEGSRLPAVIATGDPQVVVKPVAANNRALVGGGTGLSTDGMLVTVFGRVNHSTYSYCYVDDGTGLAAGKPESTSTAATGVRIDCRGAMRDWSFAGAPPDGSYVAVTGTCTAEKNVIDHTTVVRVVYPRDAGDIVVVQQ